jgi:cobalt-zinc-cadmium efflux system outer membrane protein
MMVALVPHAWSADAPAASTAPPSAPANVPAPADATTAGDAGVPLSLAQAETLLLEQNLTIAGARSGVSAAHASEIIAGYRPNPALTLSAEQFNVKHPFFHMASADPTSQGYQHFYTVRVDQLLERGDKRGYRMLSAEFQTRAAESGLKDAIRQQLFAVRQAYFTVVENRQLLTLAKDLLEITDKNEAIVTAEVAAGAAADADLITFQVNRLQFQQGVILAQQTYTQSLNDLMNVLDYTTTGAASSASAKDLALTIPTASSQLGGVELLGPEPMTLTDGLDAPAVTLSFASLTPAVDTRSDVLAARHAMEAAETAIKSAMALRQEDLDVGVEYQRNGGDDTVGLAFQINLPAFNSHQGDILQAEALYQQARFSFRQTRTQALTDIAKAFKAYDGARQLLNLYTTETIAKAKESLRIATGAYQEGGTGLVELFQTQQAYDQTLTGAIQARFAYRIALYQLDLATGDTSAPGAPPATGTAPAAAAPRP